MDIITGCIKSMYEEEILPRYLRILVCSSNVKKEEFKSFFNDCECIEIPGKIFPIIEE